MTRDVLPFPAARPARPDLAVLALPLLRRLRDALPAAAAFAAECRRLARQDARRASPPAHFFHHATAPRPVPTDVERFGPTVVRHHPKLAAAWADLSDLTADAVSLVRGSADVRRAARAVLGDRPAALADDHPGCRKMARALAVADDFPLTVLMPNAGRGWRLRLHGVTDLHHLHGLLADIIGDEVAPADADGLTALRYQFVRPSGLRDDGTLPSGPVGVDHWLWGHERPADVPAVNGERVLLAVDAPYPRAVPALPADPDVPARLDVLDVLTPAGVSGWVQAVGGRPAARRAA